MSSSVSPITAVGGNITHGLYTLVLTQFILFYISLTLFLFLHPKLLSLSHSHSFSLLHYVTHLSPELSIVRTLATVHSGHHTSSSGGEERTSTARQSIRHGEMFTHTHTHSSITTEMCNLSSWRVLTSWHPSRQRPPHLTLPSPILLIRSFFIFATEFSKCWNLASNTNFVCLRERAS